MRLWERFGLLLCQQHIPQMLLRTRTVTQNITQSPRSLVNIAPTIPPNYQPFINIDFNGRKDDHFYYRKIVELKIMTERFPNVDNKGHKTYRPTNCHVTFYYGATSLIAFAVAHNYLRTPLRDVLSGRQATYRYPLTTDPDLKRKMIQFFKDQGILYDKPAYLQTYGKDCMRPEEHFVKYNGLGPWVTNHKKKNSCWVVHDLRRQMRLRARYIHAVRTLPVLEILRFLPRPRNRTIQ